MWLAVLFLSPSALADSTDIAPALDVPKKGSWDPKGKAIDPFGMGDAKRKGENYAEAIPLLVESVEVQPGCGKCLSALAGALRGAKRFEDAEKVGMVLVQLYPDRGDGWRRISDAWHDALESQKCIDATTKYLEIEKDDANYWWRRNRHVIQLGRYDEAVALLDGGEAAGVAKEDVACMRIQVHAAKGEPAAGRELWATCDAGENVDLRRETEGWLALAEGDTELAAKRLTMAGADDFARLTIALVRIESSQFEGALNLTTKLLETQGWAWDAHLVQAEALAGLGRGDEAWTALSRALMAEGWGEKHKAIGLEQVMLRARGQTWPKEVALRTEVLAIRLLAQKGDAAGAQAVYDQAVALHGESDRLKAALAPPAPPAPAAPAPAAPAPAPAPK